MTHAETLKERLTEISTHADSERIQALAEVLDDVVDWLANFESCTRALMDESNDTNGLPVDGIDAVDTAARRVLSQVDYLHLQSAVRLAGAGAAALLTATSGDEADAALITARQLQATELHHWQQRLKEGNT